MIAAIRGAARTPFRIAAQKRALTGSMCKKFIDSPIRLAAKTTAKSDSARRRSFEAYLPLTSFPGRRLQTG